MVVYSQARRSKHAGRQCDDPQLRYWRQCDGPCLHDGMHSIGLRLNYKRQYNDIKLRV